MKPRSKLPNIIEKYPRSSRYEDVLWRQYGIANRFLAANGSESGHHSALPLDGSNRRNVQQNRQQRPLQRRRPAGAIAHRRRARKAKEFFRRGKGLRNGRRPLSRPAGHRRRRVVREGISYARQAATAEYDQNTAAQAIASYTDFITLFPTTSACRRRKRPSPGSRPTSRRQFSIAQFYEKSKK